MEEKIHQMRHFSDGDYFDFFISHNGESAEEARELYGILKEEYPDCRIFLDCMTDENGKPFFADSLNNAQYMRDALYISKVLIFVAKEQEHTFEGYGNIATEIKDFYGFQKKRFVNDRPDFNIAHFGIFLCKSVDWNNENNLFDRDAHHFSLKRANSLSDLKGSIIDMVKRIFHDQNRFVNDYAPQIYDLTRSYYEKNKEFFSVEDYIDPTFSRDDEDRNVNINFSELLRLIPDNNIIISGENGGIGKTSLLKKIFEYYLNGEDDSTKMVPIFVEANELCDNSDILLRYVEKILFNDRIDLMRDTTTREMQILKTAFTQKETKKSYLFLIDGLNEIPAEDYDEVLDQISNAAEKYTSCRFVLTSRSGSDDISTVLGRNSIFCKLRPLDKDFVKSYLSQRGKPLLSTSITLYQILSIPMYLKLYCDASDDQIMSKGELVHSLFKRHAAKADAAQDMMLRHLLPYIAYRMVVAGKFNIDEDALGALIGDFCDSACADKGYYSHYGKSFRNQLAALDDLKSAGGIKFDRYIDRFNEYIVQSCRLLRKTAGEHFEFTHQIYRDFLCAFYMRQAFVLYGENGCRNVFDIWSDRNYEKDIREFLGDLCADEGRPYFDDQANCWNYDCNENSALIKCLDRLRQDHDPDEKWVVRIITHLLSYVRKADMSGLDLSGLDLTMSDLKATVMSRRHGDKLYATNFSGARLNAENLFREANYTHFVAACINDREIATLDAGGTLTFWDRNMFNTQFIRKFKIQSDDIKKMRFSPDGKFIYAMTYNKILRIEYENGVKIETLMRSRQPLQNIYVENGKVLFTTVFNPFNKKPLDDPDAPDEVDFRFITGIAAINANKDTLIFADTAGYYGMRIFKRTEEGFKEYRFGYAQILEECMLEIEEQLRQWNVYNLFFDNPGNKSDRRMYFINKQNLFSDRSTNFSDGINGIHKEIVKQLGRRNVELVQSGKLQRLRQITDKYLKKLHLMLQTNPNVTQLSGRKLVSVDASEDGKTFLLSMQVVYEGNGRFLNKTWVLGEFNPETTEFRELVFNAHVQNVIAEYHGDEIVSIGYNKLSFYNKNKRLIRMLKTKDLMVGKLVRPQEGNSFFLAAHNYFYELDLATGNIIRGVPNLEPFDILTTDLCYAADDPEALGFKVLHRTHNEDDDGLVSFYAMDGRVRRLSADMLKDVSVIKNTANTFVTSTKNKDYKVSYEKIICYEDGVKIDEKQTCYKLFVSGCDFTGVTGGITENEAAKKILNDYSAKTDFITPAVGTSGTAADIGPAQEGTLLTSMPEGAAYFTAGRDVTLEPEHTYMIRQRRNKEEQKEALRIAENYLLTDLTVVDFHILNQVNELIYATEDVITRFVCAALSDTDEAFIRKRIWALYKELGALNCFVYTAPDLEPLRLFTLSARHGAPLLSNMLQTSVSHHSIKHKSKSDLTKELASFDYVSRIFAKHPALFTDYRPFNVVDAEENCDARANISGMLSTQNAEYFLITYRRDYTPEEVVDKYIRVMNIADDYRHIYHKVAHLSFPSRPRIILHCEDYDQCRDVYELLQAKGIALPCFTYDAFVGEFDYFTFDENGNYGMNFN